MESWMDKRLTRPPLQNHNQNITRREDAMQISLVPELPPSGGYQNIVTAKDVFSRYLFGYPNMNQGAKTVARFIFNIMTKHAYLPTTIIPDRGSVFVSQVMEEVPDVQGFTLEHAMTKHAQTIWMFKRTHVSLKKALKNETGERRSTLHKYVNFAILNYNSSHQASIVREPSRELHGRVSYNVFDLKMSIWPQNYPC